MGKSDEAKKASTVRLSVLIPDGTTDEECDKLRNATLKKIKVLAASNAAHVMHVECQIVVEREVNPNEWQTEDDESAIKDLPKRNVMNFVVPCEPVETVAVIADSAQQAIEHALDRWPNKNVRVFTIVTRTDLARLYGHQGVPLATAPGTQRLLWHRDVAFHERCGRVVPIS